jgi:hypothetical protein
LGLSGGLVAQAGAGHRVDAYIAPGLAVVGGGYRLGIRFGKIRSRGFAGG